MSAATAGTGTRSEIGFLCSELDAACAARRARRLDRRSASPPRGCWAAWSALPAMLAGLRPGLRELAAGDGFGLITEA